eukprot:130617-Rhodomonas_salina.1
MTNKCRSTNTPAHDKQSLRHALHTHTHRYYTGPISFSFLNFAQTVRIVWMWVWEATTGSGCSRWYCPGSRPMRPSNHIRRLSTGQRLVDA